MLQHFSVYSDLVESKFEAEINRRKEENINEICRSVDRVRRTLQAHLNNARSQFEYRCKLLDDKKVDGNREGLINRLEKLHLDHRQSIDGLRLIKSSSAGISIEIPRVDSSHESPPMHDCPVQSGDYVPQSSLGACVLREPSVVVTSKGFWAMGGSDQHLLVQE